MCKVKFGVFSCHRYSRPYFALVYMILLDNSKLIIHNGNTGKSGHFEDNRSPAAGGVDERRHDSHVTAGVEYRENDGQTGSLAPRLFVM